MSSKIDNYSACGPVFSYSQFKRLSCKKTVWINTITAVASPAYLSCFEEKFLERDLPALYNHITMKRTLDCLMQFMASLSDNYCMQASMTRNKTTCRI